MGSAALPQFPHSTTVPVRSLHRPSGPSPALVTAIPSCPQTHSSPLCLGVTAEPPRPRHSPTGFVLLAADAAAAEQGEQEDEQQRQEGSCPDHPHPLVGLCKTKNRPVSPGGGPAAEPGTPTRARRHSPMWQAPVSGSQAPSWQLQASAQLAP